MNDFEIIDRCIKTLEVTQQDYTDRPNYVGRADRDAIAYYLLEIMKKLIESIVLEIRSKSDKNDE